MIYSYNVKFQIFIYPQDHLFLPYGGHAICHLSRLFANNNNKKKKKTEACRYCISVALKYYVQICTNTLVIINTFSANSYPSRFYFV